MDNTIMSQVAVAQSRHLPVVAVEVRSIFAGHGLCDTLVPVIRPVTADVDHTQSGDPKTVDPGSFHPDLSGQALFENAFRAAGIH